jgi:hypothetical protein
MRFVDGLLGHDPNTLYNSNGHRCKELSDLNSHNHILFVGDNAGLRLDKPIEETFPYITAKKLSIDYYNLCIFNGGIDALKYNLFTWLHRYRPKMIILACEFINAIVVSNKHYEEFSAGDLNNEYVQDVLDSANMCGFFNARQLLLDKLIATSINIPIYQIAFKDKLTPLSSNIISIECNTEDQNEIAGILYTRISTDMQKARSV